MLLMKSLIGYAIQASDGRIGTVRDFLFDDSTWHMRWMVVQTGAWIRRKRLVLVHLPSVDHVDHKGREIAVRLTRAQVEASPDILLDEPVCRQIEYGAAVSADWDPAWGNPRYVAGPWGGMGVCVSHERLAEEKAMHKAVRGGGRSDQGDPHLRSVAAIAGNHVHATDGDIGRIEDFRVDSATWTIRDVVVGRLNWWPGKQVLIPPATVKTISWPHQQVDLTISRRTIREHPCWGPDDVRDQT